MTAAINVKKQGDINIIYSAGQLQDKDCFCLRDVIADLINAGEYKIIIDLSKTTFMCSSAWGAIIGSLKMAKRGGGGILLAAMSEEAKAGFYMANFDQIIDSCETVDRSIEAFHK